MHFYNFCTRNCDHHILLIRTGNALKESRHKLLFFRDRLISKISENLMRLAKQPVFIAGSPESDSDQNAQRESFCCP